MGLWHGTLRGVADACRTSGVAFPFALKRLRHASARHLQSVRGHCKQAMGRCSLGVRTLHGTDRALAWYAAWGPPPYECQWRRRTFRARPPHGTPSRGISTQLQRWVHERGAHDLVGVCKRCSGIDSRYEGVVDVLGAMVERGERAAHARRCFRSAGASQAEIGCNDGQLLSWVVDTNTECMTLWMYVERAWTTSSAPFVPAKRREWERPHSAILTVNSIIALHPIGAPVPGHQPTSELWRCHPARWAISLWRSVWLRSRTIPLIRYYL